MAKFEVRFDGDVCKGCGLCRVFCPKGLIGMSSHIGSRGYSPAEMLDQEACVGCRACSLVCPDGAISIYKEDAA